MGQVMSTRGFVAVRGGRDPFARTQLYRVVLPQADQGECRWCGQPAKYGYRVVSDAAVNIKGMRFDGPFCSVECYRTYHSA